MKVCHGCSQKPRNVRFAQKIYLFHRFQFFFKYFPSRDQMVILQDSARILQKLSILQELPEKWLSCKICQKNGYLARFWQKSCKIMHNLARFWQNLPESCKITIRNRLGLPWLIKQSSVLDFIYLHELCKPFLCHRSLGRLTSVRFWHDNSGVGARQSWFCDYVALRDVQTGEKLVPLFTHFTEI